MYSIGQFSLILKVSTRTLRHYDDIGLLKPATVNCENNYRYYEKYQINIGKYIMKLREAGLILDEIKEIVLDSDNNKLKLIETVEKRMLLIEDEIKKLNNMKNNLKSLQKEMLIKSDDALRWDLNTVTVVLREEICTISKRVRINISNTGQVVGSLYEVVNKYGLKISGGHYVQYHDIEYDPEDADIEVLLPVERRKESRIKFSSIPAGRYAKATSDSISGKGNVHAQIIDWIQTNGYKIYGVPIEQYGLIQDENKFKVDIYYPII